MSDPFNKYNPNTDTGVGVVYGEDGHDAKGTVIEGVRQDPPTVTRELGRADEKVPGCALEGTTEPGPLAADSVNGSIDQCGNVEEFAQQYYDAGRATPSGQLSGNYNDVSQIPECMDNTFKAPESVCNANLAPIS